LQAAFGVHNIVSFLSGGEIFIRAINQKLFGSRDGGAFV
jgi:hypothetical protein